MVLVGAALLVLLALWWLGRAAELFCLSVRDGRAIVVRGRISAGLLADLRSVVSAARVARGTIKAVRADGGARLTCSGTFDEGTQQRLRNVFGLYPASKLRLAPPIARPTLGQILGIAWLAWLLDRSSG
jgi:Protein of unknown function (DUF3634)